MSFVLCSRRRFLFVAFITFLMLLGSIITGNSAKAATTWNTLPSPVSDDLLSVAYGDNLWIAVGADGHILESVDGENWSVQPTTLPVQANGVAYTGNQWVIACDSGKIYTSSNGTTWDERVTGVVQTLWSIASNGTTIVVTGGSGTILTSGDGITWTNKSVATVNVLYGVTYGAGQFVAVGENGSLYSSSNGTTWMQQSPIWNYFLYGVTYANGLFVAVGNEGKIAVSADGVSWSVRGNPSSTDLYDVTYGGGKFVAVGASGTVVESADGMTWSSQSVGTSTTYLYSISYAKGMFAAMGTSGAIKTQRMSAIADLRNLTLGQGTLTPGFTSVNTSYTASVGYTTASVNVTPTVAESGATVTINGANVASGTAQPVSLSVGPNPITVLVTAPDGTTTKTYTVTVNRAAASNNASLSDLTLAEAAFYPTFDPSVDTYTVTVGYLMGSVHVSPTVADSTATVRVNGAVVASGTASVVWLNTGSNTIMVEVTAQDGFTQNSYTITVTREMPSTNSNLNNLTIREAALEPDFAPDTTAYKASVANGVDSINVIATAEDGGATLQVNGMPTMSGSAQTVPVNVGANTIIVVVAAENVTTKKSYTITVTRAYPNNANLSGLSISTGNLTPAFTTATTAYTAKVANGVDSINVIATAEDSGATLQVNGTPTTSGITVPLHEGANTITVLVTAQDGTTQKSYTITVTRAYSNNANLRTLAIMQGNLTPAFASGTTNYTLDVAYTTSNIDIIAEVADPLATVKVNGAVVTSGTLHAVSLIPGPNSILITVKAPDGTTTNTYKVTVTRAAPSANHSLSNLMISSGTLSPVFEEGTLSYTASVTNATTSIDITATAADSSATLTIDGNSVVSGSANTVTLHVGVNTIPIVVTAQDGTTQTYTVEVTRAASGDADLSDLVISHVTLTPAFRAGTTGYTASVPFSVSEIDITPTAADSQATLKVNHSTVASGASITIPLNVGTNEIDVQVTAQDGTAKTYRVTIVRAGTSAPPPPPPAQDEMDIVETQLHLNDQAARSIQNASNEQSAMHEVDRVMENLRKVTDSNEVSISQKIEVLFDTVTNVFTAVIDKMQSGIVTEEAVAEHTEELLSAYVNPVIVDISSTDDDLTNDATALLGDIAEIVLASLHNDQLSDDLVADYSRTISALLDQTANVLVSRNSTIDNVDEQITAIDQLISTIMDKLGQSSKRFHFEKNIIFTLEDESGELSAESVRKAAFTLSVDAVNQLVKNKFRITVRDADGNSIQMPQELLGKLKAKQIGFDIKESSVDVPATFNDHSKVYELLLFVDGKTYSQFGKSTVQVTIQHKSKARELSAYYYDEKRKNWKLLTDSRGKAVIVNKSAGFVTFPTSHFTKFMVAQQPLRSLTVKQKSLQLMPTESVSLSVTATLANGKKQDVTSAENGTTYESSNTDVVQVSENGVLTAAQDAKAGKDVTITVTNGDKSVKVKVTIVTIKSISVTSKKKTVKAGEKLPLTVTATLSNRTKLDITKGKGTAYSLVDSTYATINDDGVVKVNEDAPKDTQVKVIVANKELTAEYTVTVK